MSRIQLDIITLSETWLKDNNQLVNVVTITGYIYIIKEPRNVVEKSVFTLKKV